MASTTEDDDVPPIVPRSIDAYHEPNHVQDRFECHRRPVTRALAADAIEHGDTEPNDVERPGRTWRFRHRVDGYDVVVAAADATEHYRDFVVLTAYIDLVEAGRAWAAGAFDHKELHTIALLQYLKDAGKTVEDAGFETDTIHVTDPVDYHGHRVINKRGYSLAVCIECGHESKHGDEYKNRRCR